MMVLKVCAKKVFVAVFVLASVFVFTDAFGADWPQFLGPDRSGKSPEKGLARSWGADGPKVLWEKKLGAGYGSGAIKDGKVYILDRVDAKQDVLRCLDLVTGKEGWNFSYEADGKLSHPGSRAVPTVDGGKIYIVGPRGMMHCVDAVSHKAVWKKDLLAEFEADLPRWGLVNSPLIYKDMVIVAPQGDKGAVVALKRETGDVVWKSLEPVGGRSSYSTPIVANICGVDQVLFNCGGDSRRGSVGKVVGISAADGKLLWVYEGWSGRIPIPHPEPVGKDTVYVSGGYGAGSVMLKIKKVGEKFETEEVFKMSAKDWKGQIQQPIVYQGHMYVDNNGKSGTKPGLACISLGGEIKWQTGDIEGSPKYDRGGMLMADGMIYVVDADGYLRLVEVNPEEYKELASVQLLGGKEIWAPLAMSDGKLLIRDQEKMLCLDVSK